MILIGLCILVILIPFQIYFNVYHNLSVSIAELLSGILFTITIWRTRHSPKHLLDTGLSKAVFVFVVVLIAGILVSDDKMHSLACVIKWTSFVALYYTIFHCISSSAELRRILHAAILTMSLVSVVAIIQYIAGFWPVLHYIEKSSIAPHIFEPDTLRDKLTHVSYNWYILSANIYYIRSFGTFEGVIEFSAYLGLLIPFFIWFLASARKFSVFYISSLLLALLALIFTYTRSAYLSFFIFLLFSFFCLVKKINLKKMFLLGIFFTLIIISLFSFYQPAKTAFTTRYWNTGLAGNDRTQHWKNAIRIILARPLLGVGTANYHNGFQKYIGKDHVPLPAHNQYLQIAAETGIVGLMTYLSIFCFGITYSYRIFRKAAEKEIRLLGLGFLGMWVWYCTQSFFTTYLFGDKYSMMFWLMVGLNASLYKIYLKEQSTPRIS